MTFEPEQLGQSSQELAATLCKLRKEAGLSGDRLAARCNMSQSKVSRIESGKVRPSLVEHRAHPQGLGRPAGLGRRGVRAGPHRHYGVAGRTVDAAEGSGQEAA
ncbi:helix-turn-helix transcriptional regulator [Streptomyces sp. NPDC051909]|uniref:helix-turn-helix domain-containing protein n=1 Tax=Streptomyces sp. NPDC051909 TaxID=3154944 RepID=UPI00342FDEAD